MSNSRSNSRAAMFIAHPSHELRVYGWLEKGRPRVSVLTDGSGRAGETRLTSTTELLDKLGLERGAIYGRVTDLQLYSALLSQDFDFFIALMEEFAAELIEHETEYVVGDAAEGYNSGHDICRFMINSAVDLANKKQDREISNFDFLVVSSPDTRTETFQDGAVWVDLDNSAFLRKVEAAHSYNAKLAADIDAALAGGLFEGIKRFSEPQIAGGVDVELTDKINEALRNNPELQSRMGNVFSGVELSAFRLECLRPVTHELSSNGHSNHVPFYELYGEKLVAAGRYDHVIRYPDHLLPIVEALSSHVERS